MADGEAVNDAGQGDVQGRRDIRGGRTGYPDRGDQPRQERERRTIRGHVVELGEQDQLGCGVNRRRLRRNDGDVKCRDADHIGA